MSVLGINPTRDKMAKAVIYGGGFAYFYLIKVLALANITNPAMVYAIWFKQSNKRKEIKDEAWSNYCETGDIWKSLKPFIEN